MITVTNAFKQAIADGSRKYLCYADITLANGQVLNLTNTELWENGFSKEDAVSDDNKFTALGATIMGSASISIKNQNEEYSSYDFTNAKAVLWVGLEGIASSKIRIGTFTVDDASYTEASITLTMLDNMEQFDRPYSNSSLVYPATLFQIVQNVCTTCGVTLATASIPHGSFSIPTRPSNEGITCREVLGMAASIAGCFCRCNALGQLELKWFDRTTLDSWRTAYAGGNATQLSGMHYFTSLFSQDISVDPIVITGVRCVVEQPDSNGKMQQRTFSSGTSVYVVGIEKNELLNACTDEQIDQVVGWLGTQLNGLTFRRASISHVSSPAIEAGDIGAVWDRRNRGYPILVTRTNFSPGNPQQTVCGAETPSRNAATRYGWQTKAYAESKKQLNAEQSIREQVEQEFREAFENATGMYYTAVTENAGTANAATKYYLHNLPDLEESPVIIEFSSGGIRLTSHGINANANQWYGLTASGTMLVNLLRTTGFSFDWAQGGTLTLGGQDNTNGELRVLNSSGTEIGRFNKDGLSITNGTLSSPVITGGTIQGISISGGSIYGSKIHGAEIGGSNIYNQFMQYYHGAGSYFRLLMASGVLKYVLGSSASSYDWSNATDITGLKLSSGGWLALYHNSSSIPNDGSGNSGGFALELPGYNAHTGSQGHVYGFRHYLNSGHNIPVTHINGALVLTVGASSGKGIFWCHNANQLNSTGWSGIIDHGIVAKSSINNNKYDTNILGELYINGQAVASSSSRRYKEDIEDISLDILDPHRLLRLRVRQGRYKAEYNEYKLQYLDMAGKTLPMLIAEEVDKIYPSATIHDTETGEVESWDERRIIPGMLALIQEQHKKIEDLEERLAKLERVIQQAGI